MANQVQEVQVPDVKSVKPKFISAYANHPQGDDQQDKFTEFMNLVKKCHTDYNLTYFNNSGRTYLRIPVDHVSDVYNTGLRFTKVDFVLKTMFECDQETASKLYQKENRHSFVKTYYNKEKSQLEFYTCLRAFTLQNIVKTMFTNSGVEFDSTKYKYNQSQIADGKQQFRHVTANSHNSRDRHRERHQDDDNQDFVNGPRRARGGFRGGFRGRGRGQSDQKHE